jgi:hypothetical protein
MRTKAKETKSKVGFFFVRVVVCCLLRVSPHYMAHLLHFVHLPFGFPFASYI